MFLVTVHDPICSDYITLHNALYGSFLPVPSNDLFPLAVAEEYSRKAAPGAIIVARGPIVLNQGREKVKIKVTNKGDRPIQVDMALYVDAEGRYNFLELIGWLSLSLHRNEPFSRV